MTFERNYKKLVALVSITFLSTINFSFAATYQPLEPNAFPGLSNATSNLGGFLAALFNWAIAVAVVLAFVYIVWGGIEYMTTDSWSGKSDGRAKIINALSGLGLALISWLILYTINPNLVTFSGNRLLAPPPPQTNTSGNNNVGGNNTGNNNFSFGPTGNTSGETPSNTAGSGNDSGNCNNCIDIRPLGLAIRDTGNLLNADLANKLKSAFAGENMVVSGAVPSQDIDRTPGGCHDTGDCADVNFANYSTEVTDVKRVYDKLVAVGLKPSYEIPDQSRCQLYISAGITCTSFNSTTGSHFHVNR